VSAILGRRRLVTSPPEGGVPLAFYDGHCRFCTEQAKKLAAASRGKVAIRSFQEEGALAPFPGLTHEACMAELKLVDRDGRVYGGAEAVVRALRLGRPVLGRLALVYYLPLLRWASERTYAWIARRRYTLFGKTHGACENDACAVHLGKNPDRPG
jgi:predicted DCC family thiol-disulfide oxidoreductase YuxK